MCRCTSTKKSGDALHIDAEVISRRREWTLVRRNFQKDDAALHHRAVVKTGIVVGHACHMLMPACQMSKGMEDVLGDHAEGLVVLEQLPLRTGVGDHSLHDVINGNEIGEQTVTRRDCARAGVLAQHPRRSSTEGSNSSAAAKSCVGDRDNVNPGNLAPVAGGAPCRPAG